jgi:hypothetical protein
MVMLGVYTQVFDFPINSGATDMGIPFGDLEGAAKPPMTYDQIASPRLTATTTSYIDEESNWQQITVFSLPEI